MPASRLTSVKVPSPVVAEQVIELLGEVAGQAVHAPAVLVAAGRGRPGIGLDVGDHRQVEVAVAIQVAEAGRGRPARRADPGPLGHVLEGAVAPVAIEDGPAQPGDEQVVVAVVVDVADGAAHAVAPAGDPGPLGHVLERAVPPVAEEPCWASGGTRPRRAGGSR
jgi:hypothetical protein